MTPLPIHSAKVETIYKLLVRIGKLLTDDDFRDLESLVQAAADYESGEYEGRVVGAYEITLHDDVLVNTVPVTDLNGRVHAELQSRPNWKREQSNAARWAAE